MGAITDRDGLDTFTRREGERYPKIQARQGCRKSRPTVLREEDTDLFWTDNRNGFYDRWLATGKVVVPQRNPSEAMSSKDKAEIYVA
jgi:hypothetical protein